MRTEIPASHECVALAPPIIDAGGDHEFTCSQCGKVLAIAEKAQLDNVVFYCQGCEAYNTLGADRTRAET